MRGGRPLVNRARSRVPGKPRAGEVSGDRQRGALRARATTVDGRPRPRTRPPTSSPNLTTTELRRAPRRRPPPRASRGTAHRLPPDRPAPCATPTRGRHVAAPAAVRRVPFETTSPLVSRAGRRERAEPARRRRDPWSGSSPEPGRSSARRPGRGPPTLRTSPGSPGEAVAGLPASPGRSTIRRSIKRSPMPDHLSPRARSDHMATLKSVHSATSLGRSRCPRTSSCASRRIVHRLFRALVVAVRVAGGGELTVENAEGLVPEARRSSSASTGQGPPDAGTRQVVTGARVDQRIRGARPRRTGVFRVRGPRP